jgi:hypothetical protein
MFAAADVGFDAWRLARSGLDDLGIGGGVLSVDGIEFCLGCVLLPKPISSADFLGGGAITRFGGASSCGSSRTGVGCSCLTPLREGNGGVGLP